MPQYFALYNSISRTTGSFSSHAVYYNNISLKHGKAGDCIGCGQCEKTCPQHLPIRQYLKDVAKQFETGASFPARK
ncbi:MAG: 4Fe-4S dicluster domain-containing protein [Ruminococcus sp.]